MDETTTARTADAPNSSTAELVKQLSEQVTRRARDERRLAQLETTRKATPAVPERAVDSVKADVEEIKESAHR